MATINFLESDYHETFFEHIYNLDNGGEFFVRGS